MNIVLYFSMIYINAVFISFLTKKKLSFCIPFSLFLIMLFGYFFAMLGLLYQSIWIILIITILELLYLIYLIYKKKIDYKKYITSPCTIYMLVIMVITILLFNNSYVDKWDELVQWAIYAKNMYINNKLFDLSFTSVQNAYPPIIAITQYTVCKLGGVFSEADLHRVSYFVAVLPLTIVFSGKYKSKLRYICLVLLSAFFPLLFFSTFLRSSYVDVIVAMLAGFMFLALIAEDVNYFNLVLFFIAGCILTTTKEIGFYITGILYVVVLFDMLLFRRKQYFDLISTIWNKNKAKFVFMIFMAMLPIIIHYYWIYYAEAVLLVGNHETEMSLNTWSSATISNYLFAIIHTPVASANKVLKFPTIVWLIIFISILLSTMIKSDRIWRRKIIFAILAIIIIYVLYNIAQLVAYISMFSESESIGLTSYERYLRILLLELEVITYFIILPKFINCISKTFWIYLFTCVLAFNPKPIVTTTKLATIGTTDKENFERRFSYSDSIISKLSSNDRVFYIDQNLEYRGYDGYNYWVIRYKLTPIRVQDDNWSILIKEKLTAEDTWTKNMSVEEWSAKLREFDYVYLAVTSEQFKEDYSSLFCSNISDYTLYKVVYSNNELQLESN